MSKVRKIMNEELVRRKEEVLKKSSIITGPRLKSGTMRI
jgi:hypothetical protein